MHLYSPLSLWIYSNALYNIMWGTFARLLYGAVHNLFNLTSRIHRCPQSRISDANHNTGNFMPYSLRIVCGFFNVPQLLGSLSKHDVDESENVI